MSPEKFDISMDLDLDVAEVPLLSDIERLMHETLMGHLRFIQNNPTMADLEGRAHLIIEDIRVGASLHLPSVSKLAIFLALKVYLNLERLGFSRQWYEPLMSLFNPAEDLHDDGAQADLYRALLFHYLYRGDLTRANTIVQALMDIVKLEQNGSLQNLMIGAASIAAMGGEDRNPATMQGLAYDLLTLAHETHDVTLIGQVYGVLSQYYVHEYDSERTFEYGQMTYCVGISAINETFLINGLHFMALAFQITRQPERAIPYLKLATERARKAKDKARLGYLMHSWATCHYFMGNYLEADNVLREFINLVDDQGAYYAAGLHTHGLVLTRQERFAEALQTLQKAAEAWKKLGQPFDVLCAQHALADVYFHEKCYETAISNIQVVITDTEALDDKRQGQLLAELQKDLEKYIAERDAADRAQLASGSGS